jgi:hypothetical protein
MNLSEKDFELLWGRTVPDTKFDVDANGNIIYEGLYKTGTATSKAEWVIARYFYDGNNNIVDMKIRTNISWDNRSSIS